jgi:preprotein translocase subunit SecF
LQQKQHRVRRNKYRLKILQTNKNSDTEEDEEENQVEMVGPSVGKKKTREKPVSTKNTKQAEGTNTVTATDT